MMYLFLVFLMSILGFGQPTFDRPDVNKETNAFQADFGFETTLNKTPGNGADDGSGGR